MMTVVSVVILPAVPDILLKARTVVEQVCFRALRLRFPVLTGRGHGIQRLYRIRYAPAGPHLHSNPARKSVCGCTLPSSPAARRRVGLDAGAFGAIVS